MAAAMQSKSATVWAQDLAEILRGASSVTSKEFEATLHKIQKARQDGKFPLNDQESKSCNELQKAASREFEVLKDVKGIDRRCKILFCEFFVTVTDTKDCELTEKQRSEAQTKYLPKMLNAIKAQDLLENPTVKNWLSNFAIASYSRVIDALDKLYERFDQEERTVIEQKSQDIAIQLFQAYQDKKYTSDELENFIKFISTKHSSGNSSEELVDCKNDYLQATYVRYEDLATTYFVPVDKVNEFWNVRQLSLTAFLAKL